jgi:hypothetical protein
MRRVVLLLAIVSVSLAACGSSSKSATPATTTTTASIPSTTAAIPSSTTAPAPNTTVPPATSSSIPTVVKESAYVDSVNLAAHTITIDPMEFLTGQAATTEYHKANPNTTGGPDNDYYIVNPTKDHVVLPLEPTAVVRLVQVNGVPHTDPLPQTQAQFANYSALTRAPFWITIERGNVTEVIEQFVP